MDFSSSLNGIKAALGAQALNANNIANINSNSYKSKRPLVQAGKNNLVETKASVLYTQGPLHSTGNPADITVTGNKAIQLESPTGEKIYRRTVNLQIDPQGKLKDSQGNYVSGVTGKIDDFDSLIINEDGSILTTDGKGNTVEVGQLLLGTESQSRGFITGSGSEKVLQGYTESSNVDLAENMVGQMQNEQTLKANIAAIKTQDEMLGDIIDLKG